MLKLLLDAGLLGEYDYHRDTIELGDIQKPTMMLDLREYLIRAVYIIGSVLGLVALYIAIFGISGIIFDCCGDAKKEVYHIVYEDGEKKDLIYETKRQGCSSVTYSNFEEIARDRRFFSEEGYYNNDNFKKMVIAPNGQILEKLRSGATYYSKSRELYVGEERNINIQFKDGSIYPIEAIVGSSIVGMPSIPTLEGYEFVGGYCGSSQVISSSQEWIDSTFHLYNYGSIDQVLNVELVYEKATCEAKVYINSSFYTIQFKYGTILNDIVKEAYGYIQSNIKNNQEFIGWSFTNKESELISDGTLTTQKVTHNIELYAIIRTEIM